MGIRDTDIIDVYVAGVLNRVGVGDQVAGLTVCIVISNFGKCELRVCNCD